jgi:exosortase C (VPDSG-CTERM-specific)
MSELKPSPAHDSSARNAEARRFKAFGWFAAGLTLIFAWPLLGLVRFAWQNDFHSHALLIPCVVAYLIWQRRKELSGESARSPLPAGGMLLAGLVALAGLWSHGGMGTPEPRAHLALATLGYLLFLGAGAFWFLGGRLLRHCVFPAVLLVFLLPMPLAMENAIEVFLQHASAEAASLFFTATGSTVYREGLVFRLPGIAIQVAQECSGIRSSLVLFITSLIAGDLLLKSRWRRAALTLFVIPLAILRNGFRVFTIAMLCVHVSPRMIDSPIHHQGGPIFFALSLIPFFLFLLWLRRGERRREPRGKIATCAGGTELPHDARSPGSASGRSLY